MGHGARNVMKKKHNNNNTNKRRSPAVKGDSYYVTFAAHTRRVPVWRDLFGLTLLFNARSLAFIGRHLAITFTFSEVIAAARQLCKQIKHFTTFKTIVHYRLSCSTTFGQKNVLDTIISTGLRFCWTTLYYCSMDTGPPVTTRNIIFTRTIFI